MKKVSKQLREIAAEYYGARLVADEAFDLMRMKQDKFQESLDRHDVAKNKLAMRMAYEGIESLIVGDELIAVSDTGNNISVHPIDAKVRL